MEDPTATPYRPTKLDSKTGRALIVCGLWMRLAFVGASAVAVGVIQLFGGDAGPVGSLALAAAGAVLAVLSWRRAYAALSDADTPETPIVTARAPEGVRSVAGA